MSTDDPNLLADAAEALAVIADPHAYRQYIAGALPAPPASPFAPEPEQVDVGPMRTEPAVPSWVRDRAKWLTLFRAERRAVQRHHERQQRGR